MIFFLNATTKQIQCIYNSLVPHRLVLENEQRWEQMSQFYLKVQQGWGSLFELNQFVSSPKVSLP